uniref:Uncharacterized protein n=1 Tax=Anopheles epiroticus TaxID=199890 RepID=A0A182PCJ3_9DIPT
MEYSSFVRELRRESHSPLVCLSDTQYAREFEEQMQALVINFDIEEETQAEEEWCSSFTSTPVAAGSGKKCKPRIKAACTVTRDERERTPEEEEEVVPKKKMAVNIDQSVGGAGPESSQSSVVSSEGISMRYDSCNSIDDMLHLEQDNEFAHEPSNRSEAKGLLEMFQAEEGKLKTKKS